MLVISHTSGHPPCLEQFWASGHRISERNVRQRLATQAGRGRLSGEKKSVVSSAAHHMLIPLLTIKESSPPHEHPIPKDSKAGGLGCQDEGVRNRGKDSCRTNGNIRDKAEALWGHSVLGPKQSTEATPISTPQWLEEGRGMSVLHPVIFP